MVSASVNTCLRAIIFALLPLLLVSCNQNQWQQAGLDALQSLNDASRNGAPLSAVEIELGLREALRVGSERVVSRVGRNDGFNGDLNIRIPLPDKLDEARALARKFGLDKPFDEIEIKLNRAAERAAPQAKALFWQAVRDMRLADVRAILNGPQDAATRYFEGKMSSALARAMRPIIDQSLDEVGAIRSYKRALTAYNNIPFAPQVEGDLSGHVVENGIAGIFYYLAQEEAAIRRDPLKRSSEILRRVFGTS